MPHHHLDVHPQLIPQEPKEELPDFSNPLCPLCGAALRLRPLIVYNPVKLRREQIDELLWCPNGECDFAFPLKELVRKTIAA